VAQCDFCFRDKSPLQPLLPGLDVHVCKACSYETSKVIGFLRHSGAVISVPTKQPTYRTDDLSNPPAPLKSKIRRSKLETGADGHKVSP